MIYKAIKGIKQKSQSFSIFGHITPQQIKEMNDKCECLDLKTLWFETEAFNLAYNSLIMSTKKMVVPNPARRNTIYKLETVEKKEVKENKGVLFVKSELNLDDMEWNYQVPDSPRMSPQPSGASPTSQVNDCEINIKETYLKPNKKVLTFLEEEQPNSSPKIDISSEGEEEEHSDDLEIVEREERKLRKLEQLKRPTYIYIIYIYI